MRKPALICAVLLLAAACSGSDINDPKVTTTVQVSSTPTVIAVGETAQASAVVRDQDGNPLSGKEITWTSLNQSIATVTPAAGLIRGVAPGNATIQGTVDGVTGTASIQVVAISNVCADGATVVNVDVGQVRVLSALDTQGCVSIASTPAASEYIVITANTNALPDVFPTFALRSDNEALASSSLLASPARVVASLVQAPVKPAMELQTAFENRLRKAERTLHLPSAQRAFSEGSLQRGPRYSVTTAAAVVGDKTQFKIPKSCTSFTTVTATVRHISNRAIIYSDDASPAGGFTNTDLQEIATEFDNLVYPTDVDYFGTPLDLDSNSRIIILYTPEVNKLTPTGNPSGFVGGFFFAGDLFPTSTCAQSNRAELFYLLTPDPDGSIVPAGGGSGNKRTRSDVRQGTRGTIAHEFQHMINASERIRHPVTTELESVWLDEALSHFAEDLNGRTLKGLGETGNYTYDQLTANGTQVNDFNAFFYQNFARLARYYQNPGPNAPTSQHADSSLAARGAAWALLRYAADHHAPAGDIKAFLKSLVPGPDTGVVNLRTKAGNVVFDSLAAGWMAANAADDAGISGLAAKYTYRTYHMRSNVARVNTPSQTFPLLVTPITGPTFTANPLQARSGSGNYFRLSRVAGAPARLFRMTNADLTTAATFSGATFIIIRTQ
ncbi:MAG: Ig-like domain-containing protein [Gemmatimonadaceae bacterium]